MVLPSTSTDRHDQEDTDPGGVMDRRDIVVVLDGSEASLSAVRWAAAQSQSTGDRLVVLHTFEVEPGTADAATLRTATESVHRTRATTWLRQALDGSHARPYSTRLEVVEGPLDRVVSRLTARSASLVVVSADDGRGPDLGHGGVPVVLVPAPQLTAALA
jgi:hypothetical protein